MLDKITSGLSVCLSIILCTMSAMNGDSSTAFAWGVAALWAFNVFIRSL